MLDLLGKVISDGRVIAIFIIIALYLRFVGFVAAYKKSNNLKKAMIQRPVKEEAPKPAESSNNEEEAAATEEE